MGFLDDIKNKAGELGEKAGDAFEAAKDKAGDLVDNVKDRLDTDDDGDIDTADASHAFDSIKDKVTGGGDAPADQAAAAAGAGGAAETLSDPAAPVESVSDPAAGPLGEPAADDALGDPLAPAPDPLAPAPDPLAPSDPVGDSAITAPDLIGDEDAAAPGADETISPDLTPDAGEPTTSAEEARDDALGAVSDRAEDLRTDNA